MTDMEQEIPKFYYDLGQGIDGKPVLVKRFFTRGEYIMLSAALKSENKKGDNKNDRIS